MEPVLRSLVDSAGGVLTRARALEVVAPWVLRQAYRRGCLCRILPAVYVDANLVPGAGQLSTVGSVVGVGLAAGAGPAATTAAGATSVAVLAAVAPEVARRAVLAYADGRAAFSQLTALDVHGLRRQPPGEPLHLDVPAGSGLRSRPHLVMHHRTAFTTQPPQVVVRQRLPVTRLEDALVQSWPLLPPEEQAGPVIRAVNDRLTTPRRLGVALSLASKLTGRAELANLVDRLAAGCRSPLEIWGHDRVFTGPDMPALRRQVRVRVGERTMYLDLFAERERVDIELDGTASHGDPRQREVDLRRDALLATVGILVVRFAHRRLVREPDEVRRETLAILATRR
ncbi:DUF559 domain-containing protein [Micromonospora sp. NPDC051296]|uniref:endonuclease domain-containing protein n=1 Tax=Micromonospora sp. NPDC051296 TaxID=3155046 RepID=UPI00343BDE42